MTLFLTSSPTLGIGGSLNPANGLIHELKASLPHPIHCLVISSMPDNPAESEHMAIGLSASFARSGLTFERLEVLDSRTKRNASRLIHESNFIILSGGHVPTENRFFHELRLASKLRNYRGIMLGISAGSMNAADVVYATPELEGEAIGPNYMRFLTGIGLTQINILPHYQELKHATLDGKRIIDEIVAVDSYARPIYCLPDGSYFIITSWRAELRGEAYCMRYGKLKQVCHDEEKKTMCKNGTFRQVR